MYNVTISVYNEILGAWISKDILVNELPVPGYDNVILNMAKDNKIKGGDVMIEVDVDCNGVYYDHDEFVVTINDDYTQIINWD